MSAARVEAIKLAYEPIWSHQGLVFEGMDPPVARKVEALLLCWLAYKARYPIYELPTV